MRPLEEIWVKISELKREIEAIIALAGIGRHYEGLKLMAVIKPGQ